MDSRIGLDYIVENREYVAKLASALDTANTTVKKQVFELLSALCVYNADGYSRTLDALEHFKKLKDDRYRFGVVVRELREASSVEYKTALVAFINCIIISTPQLKDRLRIRNEFVGLKLLSILNELKGEAASDTDLAVQIDVFEEQRESDESQLQGPDGVDLSSHLDVFHAILRQVVDTPQEIPFLSILQHLLRVDPKEAVSDTVWDTAETLVHRATLMDSKEDSAQLLRSAKSQKNLTKAYTGAETARCFCNCHRDEGLGSSKSRKQSLNLAFGSQPGGLLSPTGGAPPPPPPPPPPPGGGPPPPPPPPPPGGMMPPPPPPPPSIGGPPPPPPPAFGAPPAPPTIPNQPSIDPELKKLRLPQLEIPKPKFKMRTLNWVKLPDNKIFSHSNIWTTVAKMHQKSPMAELDWAEMEGLFCQQQPAGGTGINGNPAAPSQAGTKISNGTLMTPGTPDTERKKERNFRGNLSITFSDEMARISVKDVTLLDGKRSLNINIFLKQFRSSNAEIAQMIREGAHDDIGTEKLRGLLKILPPNDEVEMLRAYDGDRARLGNAEKFLLMHLMTIPNYRLRIESMLLKEEFASNVAYLEPSINAMIMAGDELKHNTHLQDVLYMVVVAGNFLNSGGYAGNAAGVKLASLQKLADIRANKPGMNLIHFVAQQAEKKDKALLKMPEEMLSVLDEATKTTVDQLRNEVNALDLRIKNVGAQVEAPATPQDIKSQMAEFLQAAKTEVAALQEDLLELDAVRVELSDFFCEDRDSFKLEECFKLFLSFCQRFRQGVMENEHRKQQEAAAESRRKQREEQLALKRRQSGSQSGSTGGADSENVMDSLLLDIRCGFPMRDKMRKGKKIPTDPSGDEDQASALVMAVASSPRVSRKRIGSTSGAPNSIIQQSVYEKSMDDSLPEDVTPNGSLRRRRSRVPSEEDDNSLMDYLRTSGHADGSRERKSTGNILDGYGSLDRSWARNRTRGPGGGPPGHKKRPDLMTADFTGSGLAQSPLAGPPPDTSSISVMSTLEPLPEAESGSGSRRSPRRDWKPTRLETDTDVVGAMEAIEDASSTNRTPWRRSAAPESSEADGPRSRFRRMRSRNHVEEADISSTPVQQPEEDKEKARKAMIGSLGRQGITGNDEKLTIYIKQDEPGKDGRRRSSESSTAAGSEVTPAASTTSSRLLDRYRQQTALADTVVPKDLLRSIEESERRESYDRSPAPLPPATASSSAQQASSNALLSAADREKKRYQRTMTPNTLRSKLQEKLISGFDTNELAGTIASINGSNPGITTSSTKLALDDVSGTGESETALPPIQPGSRSKIRRSSRGGGELDAPPSSNHDVDSENIETPPVIRRAYGSRPFGTTGSSGTTPSSGAADEILSSSTSGVGGKTGKAEDEELGDGRFDRFSSVRRTRRLRKAPEGAEEECLEPRKSPEGVEDPNEADHSSSRGSKSAGDVIVGMEVKKEGEVSTVEVTRRMSEEREPEDKDRRLARWREMKMGANDAEAAVMSASGATAVKARTNRPFSSSRSTELDSPPPPVEEKPSVATEASDNWRTRLASRFRSPEKSEVAAAEEDPLALLRAQQQSPSRSRSSSPLKEETVQPRSIAMMRVSPPRKTESVFSRLTNSSRPSTTSTTTSEPKRRGLFGDASADITRSLAKKFETSNPSSSTLKRTGSVSTSNGSARPRSSFYTPTPPDPTPTSTMTLGRASSFRTSNRPSTVTSSASVEPTTKKSTTSSLMNWRPFRKSRDETPSAESSGYSSPPRKSSLTGVTSSSTLGRPGTNRMSAGPSFSSSTLGASNNSLKRSTSSVSSLTPLRSGYPSSNGTTTTSRLSSSNGSAAGVGTNSLMRSGSVRSRMTSPPKAAVPSSPAPIRRNASSFMRPTASSVAKDKDMLSPVLVKTSLRPTVTPQRAKLY